jgi:protein gp37
MSANSKIQWTDHTFNPWIGCTKVAPECKHCYAEAMALRYRWSQWGKGKPRRRTAESTWRQPREWNARAANGTRPKVFCASLADVFDEEVDSTWRHDLFRLILETPNLDWLILTKRPSAARTFYELCNWPELPNVWLGVSAGVDPAPLLEIPATIHFLSCEPMLHPCKSVEGFDWVIFGGESGKHARTCDPNWIREGVAMCRESGAAPFVKQLGTRACLTDYHGGDWSEWPEDLRVREFPVIEEGPLREVLVPVVAATK